ncbi:hypothetical protein NDU88_001044 [Pleurodeles waltl]|uniref:Uncharacterized protein n=1 Tax=Pleurodeles waltl TaxID=8319 RepID=A0AAV7NHW5_PLEWA|nr:hypothetical protein NDU88_001044 [Pleurodeles waltl]
MGGGTRYSLLFPSKLKIILDGSTHFFQEPDEAWAWLESYRTGTMGGKHVERKSTRRRGKKRHSQDSTGSQRVTIHTNQQAHQGKRVVLQGAASLIEGRSSDEGQRSGPETLDRGDFSDVGSATSVMEELLHVTPQTSDDIV